MSASLVGSEMCIRDSCYMLQCSTHIIRIVEKLGKSDDVATLANSKVIPLVSAEVHLERWLCLRMQWRQIIRCGLAASFGLMSQCAQIVREFDFLCLLYVHLSFIFVHSCAYYMYTRVNERFCEVILSYVHVVKYDATSQNPSVLLLYIHRGE